MLKVHKKGNKYYNKNNICVARESERTRARNRKRKSKRKEKPFVMNHIIRASALCVWATNGRSYHRAWRRRVMRSVKKKFVPARTIRIKSAFCRRFPRVSCAPLFIKPRPGGKFLLCGKESVFNRFCRLRRFAKALRAHA